MFKFLILFFALGVSVTPVAVSCLATYLSEPIFYEVAGYIFGLSLVGFFLTIEIDFYLFEKRYNKNF